MATLPNLIPSVGALIAVLATSCVDAPVRPEHLQADGQLHSQGLEQSAFSAPVRAAPQQAVQITAVLAAQSEGALEDAQRFDAQVGRIHLHLRADSLAAPRPVTYVWSHEDIDIEMPGVLAPTTTLSLATTQAIQPSQTGPWSVTVLERSAESAVQEPAKVLYRREFEVRR